MQDFVLFLIFLKQIYIECDEIYCNTIKLKQEGEKQLNFNVTAFTRL